MKKQSKHVNLPQTNPNEKKNLIWRANNDDTWDNTFCERYFLKFEGQHHSGHYSEFSINIWDPEFFFIF